MPHDYDLEIGHYNQEINFPEESVDQNQAFLRYDSQLKELVIQDSNSKYGTMILI